MSFDPKNFIGIAKELYKGSTEAHYRSMINRAYYSVFGHIKNNLPGFYSSGSSVHQDLIKSLKNSLSDNEIKAGFKLESLFKKRKDADYDYKNEIKQGSCSFTISEAEAIIKLFDNKESVE